MKQDKGLLIHKEYDVRDWRFGGVSGIERTILRGDGNWAAHRPKKENQHFTYFDTMGCVSFSALNCLEYMYDNKYRESLNFSDRFTAKMSGTTKAGNYFTHVGKSIQEDGLLYEDEYDFDGSREAKLEWDDYYQEIDTSLKGTAATRKEFFETFYEWVNLDDLYKALQYSPIQIGIKYCSVSEAVNGIIPRKEGKANHAVTLEWIDDDGNFHIFDHYAGNEVKVLAPDYKIDFAMAHYINKKVTDKPMPIIQIPNDTLVQNVEVDGEVGIALDDKIMVDELDKITATFILRNGGDIKGKIRPLKKAEWDSFPKMNIKKELIR